MGIERSDCQNFQHIWRKQRWKRNLEDRQWCYHNADVMRAQLHQNKASKRRWKGYLLYKIDHAGLCVGHLPVFRQGLLTFILCVPDTPVHGAGWLVVAWHRLPPVCFVLVICNRAWREGHGHGDGNRNGMEVGMWEMIEGEGDRRWDCGASGAPLGSLHLSLLLELLYPCTLCGRLHQQEEKG